MSQIMSKPDPTISQNMVGIDDEAILGKNVDSAFMQSSDSEGWIVVIRKRISRRRKRTMNTTIGKEKMCVIWEIH